MLTKERINDILTETLKYTITLANDPTVLGPKYLQDQIATCRNYTNHVARLMNEVHRAIMEVDFDLRRKETAFRISADELLSNNPSVRGLPNITDRQAQINLLLREEHRVIENLKNDLKDLQHVEKIVKNIHRELKDTMNEIKLQRSLIRDEIDTGRMYGDERPSVERAYQAGGAAKMEDIDDDEIDRMLKGEIAIHDVDAAEPAVTVADTPEVSVEVEAQASEPEKPSEPVTDEEHVLAFFGKADATPAPILVEIPSNMQVPNVASEEDFTDIFDQMMT